MIRGFLSKNIWLKIISFAVAVALWFFVIISSRSESVVEVPLEYIDMPPGLEVIVAPDTVSVSLEGYKRVIESVRKEDVRVILNMSDTKRGRNIFPLSENDVKLPRSLEVKSIFPQTISLMLQEK